MTPGFSVFTKFLEKIVSQNGGLSYETLIFIYRAVKASSQTK
jgi:hypothetical protein